MYSKPNWRKGKTLKLDWQLSQSASVRVAELETATSKNKNNKAPKKGQFLTRCDGCNGDRHPVGQRGTLKWVSNEFTAEGFYCRTCYFLATENLDEERDEIARSHSMGCLCEECVTPEVSARALALCEGSEDFEGKEKEEHPRWCSRSDGEGSACPQCLEKEMAQVLERELVPFDFGDVPTTPELEFDEATNSSDGDSADELLAIQAEAFSSRVMPSFLGSEDVYEVERTSSPEVTHFGSMRVAWKEDLACSPLPKFVSSFLVEEEEKFDVMTLFSVSTDTRKIVQPSKKVVVKMSRDESCGETAVALVRGKVLAEVPLPLWSQRKIDPIPLKSGMSSGTFGPGPRPMYDMKSKSGLPLVSEMDSSSIFTFHKSMRPLPVKSSFQYAKERGDSKWSWLIERLTARSKLFADSDRNIRVTRALHRVVESKRSVGSVSRFSVLPSVKMVNCKVTPFWAGAVAPERKVPRSVKNQAFVRWSSRCLAEKFRLNACSVERQRKVENGGMVLTRSIPETLSQVKTFFSSWFTSSVVSRTRFHVVSRHLEKWYRCPESGFKIDHVHGHFFISKQLNGSGISIRSNGLEILHLGSPEASGVIRKPSALERRFSRSLSDSISNDYLDGIQAELDTIPNPSKVSQRFDVNTVSDRISPWNNRAFLATCNPQGLKTIAVYYKTKYGCPEGLVKLNFNRIKRIVEFIVDDDTEIGMGLHFYLDNKHLFHCGKGNEHYGRPTLDGFPLCDEDMYMYGFESKLGANKWFLPIENLPRILGQFGSLPPEYKLVDGEGGRKEYVCDLDECMEEPIKSEITRLRTQSRIWRAAAKTMLNLGLKRKATRPQPSHILCTNPWFDKQLMGFTVCAKVDGCSIFSRGMDFSREDDRPGREGLLTVRQYKRFWDIGGKQLVFTPKGLAKMFYRKQNHEKWRYAICRAIGLTLDAGYIFFSKFQNKMELPDLVFAEEETVPYSGKPISRIHHVYVEIPVGKQVEVREKIPTIQLQQTPMENVQEAKLPTVVNLPVPPVPQPLPSILKRKSQEVDGDEWLCAFGREGKSNRSIFRNKFPADWHARISGNALRLMNNDLKDEEGYRSKTFNPEILITDPSLKFELYPKRTEEEIKSDGHKGKAMVTFGRPSGPSRPLRKVPEDKKRHMENLFTGKVKEFKPQVPEVARDSTVSDIETNPGPTFRTPCSRDSSNRFAHSPSNSVVSLTLTPATEPLIQEEWNDNAPPIFELADDHEDQRDSTKHDINPNPGPKGQEKLAASSSDRHMRRPSITRLLDKLGLEVKGKGEDEGSFTLSDLRQNLGMEDIHTFPDFHLQDKGHPQTSKWVDEQFNWHQVVGHLPYGIDWKSKLPIPIWSAVGFNELQSSLDELNIAPETFTIDKVGRIVSAMNKFFQRDATHPTLEGKHVSALAHYIKTMFRCPRGGFAAGFEINTTTKEILFHCSDIGNEETANRIWWILDGYPMVHGGSSGGRFTMERFRLYLLQVDELATRRAKKKEKEYMDKIESEEMDDDPMLNHHVLHKQAPTYQELLLFNRICAFFSIAFYYYLNFFYPVLTGNRENLTEGGTDFPTYPVDGTQHEQSLLVCALGTRGDQIPVKYYAQLAAEFGVKTHYHVFQDMNHDDLEDIRRGNMLSSLPGYLNLQHAPSLGYKAVMMPHFESKNRNVLSYVLAPSSKYIKPVKFVKDYFKIKVENWLPVFLADRVTESFKADLRIGALRDCDLPRSIDGLTLLTTRKNNGKYEAGWCSGSAAMKVIPDEIRSKYPRIPNGDHQVLFRDYKTIYMHGGAGTVQTAIACGAKVVICDPTLDRDYHTLPTGKDIKQPSVGPYMGWLIVRGFKVDSPWEIKILWLISYWWSIKYSIVHNAIYALLKLYAISNYLYSNWALFLILFFTVPTVIWKSIYRSTSIITVVKSIFKVIWDVPVVCLMDSKVGLAVSLYSLSKIGSRFLQDVSNLARPLTELIFEPVIRGGIIFPFPFGHYCLRDRTTGDIYEGLFLSQRDQGIGDLFTLKRVKRDLKPNAKIFPAPFNIGAARMEILRSNPLPYSSTHNCATISFRLISRRSVVWSGFMLSVASLIFIALSPPQFLKTLCEFFFPNVSLRETPFYRSLGFAAGIENIPFEQEMIEDGEPAYEEPAKIIKVDWSAQETFDGLVAEISCIQNNIISAGIPTLDESDVEEVSTRTFDKVIEEIQIPEESLLILQPLPPYVKHTWAQIVDGLHHALWVLRQNPFLSNFIAWLKTIETSVLEFIAPVLEGLGYLANVLYLQNKEMFHKLFVRVCNLLDHVWGLEASKRVKTVWGLTGLHRTGLLGIKARLAASIAYSEYVGRTNFESDYGKFVKEISTLATETRAKGKSKIGGPQRRPIGYGKPLMAKQEAELLGFKEGEYYTEKVYQDRVDSYLTQGTNQGADGVFLASKMPELISKSQHRYEPKYPALTSEDRQMAREIAEAMFDQYPEVFANCDIVGPGSVHAYIKKKYSPGTPFINGKGFKSRQAIFDAGYDKVIQRRAREYLEKGEYPVQFYHAFVKSQVVDIKKCLPESMGGKGKDVRTVVSQDLFSYSMEQLVQIERNKRKTWLSYGAGIGMPLNQSMEAIYNRMADHQKERGGRYIIMDATAFDSFCKPILFEVNSVLWELGFKDHPSGNGKNIASVAKASYDSRQNCWIIGVTEPEYNSLCIHIDEKVKDLLISRNSKLVDLRSLCDQGKLKRLSPARLKEYIANIIPPEGKTVVTWDPVLRPKFSNWMGKYEFGELSDVDKKFFEHQTFTYDKRSLDYMEQDIAAIASSNYQLTSNVHPKNRGGSTGGSDTSSINTHAFKAGVIYSWSKTTGRPPRDFFKFNDLANTSDDTIWQSGGTFGLNTVEDVEVFRQHCISVGIHLTIDTTKNICEAEYLSKFVRPPTHEDSLTLKKWREQKFKMIVQAHQRLGMSAPRTIGELNNPRRIVVQNPAAILLRRSAFRYYQSDWTKWRYVSVERGAGHANNTAFVPELYNRFAVEWCEDTNKLLEQHNIHRKFVLQPTGQFGLPCVEQIDPRSSQQALSPRQSALLTWLKTNMFPSYYKVIDTHMNIAKIDPDLHAKFLRKLERGWRGWDEIIKQGADMLFAATNSIPDEWSKKFQPQIEMLYVEQPFYTRNKIVEKFIYLKLLEESTMDEITFADFSSRIQESPYGGVTDPYHFWESLGDPEFKSSLLEDDILKYQGLVLFISALYMISSFAEWSILATPILGICYKLFIWSSVGLNKVYGVMNTLYWHSTGKSSREISRMMPRDPYLTSKRFCAFLVDFVPSVYGYTMAIPCMILNLFPEMLDCVGKISYKGLEMKSTTTPNMPVENPWSSYADEYVEKLRASPTNRAYVAAKTSTGKSTYFVSSLWAARFRQKIGKIWVIEPRRVLRDETKIPFGVPTQILKRGVEISRSADVYILTYGHALSRLMDMDPEQDVVLFDEFHEQQGEMILGLKNVKCPIFLLSATPAEIPLLKGSPYLQPNIDRRHPITIHKVDDSMSVVDMFMEGLNRYPELCHRALIIVPTHKQVQMTINSLNDLKVGKVSSLTARERTVAQDGILVCTPYVQTGLDIKPPPLIEFDCGKDIVIDKGVLLHPFPWTSPDVNKQRIGRVGRLQAGVVFQPESAGTGKPGVMYPSPIQFSHKVVAEHFKMPQLQPMRGAISFDLNFMAINNDVLRTRQERKSVIAIHTLALVGVRQAEWKLKYCMLQEGRKLGEDYELVDKMMEHNSWKRERLLSWDSALYHLNRDDVIFYNIEGDLKPRKPISAINGRWVELEESPTTKLNIGDDIVSTFETRTVRLQKQLNKFKSALLSHAQEAGDKHFQKVSSIIG